MRSTNIVLLKIYLFVSISSVNSVDPLVRTKHGLVRGRKATDGLYSIFLGIPYAKVDLNYPFRAADPPPDFGDDIFNAYDGSIICPQMIISKKRQFVRFKETADCLRLNVYVPYEASYTDPLPVLVWIHGGGFTTGYGTEYNPKYLIENGIIVVTVNYRLGPYGFICLDEPLVSGNRGLKDQYQALQWIVDNIDAFGGNSSDITIAGQNAGAVSVLLHLYSNKDKLYSKVIAQSGTTQSIVDFVDGDQGAAIKIAEYLNFNTTDNEAALDFLAKLPSYEVTDAAVDLSLEFAPCKENIYSGVDFIVENYPMLMSNANKIRNTQVLIGHTTKEAESLFNPNENFKNKDPFVEQLQIEFNLNDAELEEISRLVRLFYIGEEDFSNSIRSKIVDFRSDLFLNHPIQRTIARLLCENAGPVYEYLFSYENNNGIPGAQGSDLSYLFPSAPLEVSNNETQLLIGRITTLWANFVKHGNPTPEATKLLPVIWKPVTKETRPYLDIDKELQLKDRVFKERMAFWDLFYSIYGENHKLSKECSY